MTTVAAKTILFVCMALLVHTYAGFALLMRVVSRVMKNRVKRDREYRPVVTILIPAYNEEKVLRRKIENCLAFDYPRDRLEIMVCSDCSTDRTAEIAREYVKTHGITFCDYRERSGKTGLINRSLPRARGEIVVLTDANTMIEPDGVRELVSMYSSPRVGAVLGLVRLTVPKDARGVQKEVTYREFESALKHGEGLLGAAMGAFGGFYSIRKELFTPLPPNAYSNDDFIVAAKILSRGYRVLYNREAVSTEETGHTVEEEFTRRVRIGAGDFQAFFFLPQMLNPLRPIPCFIYVSHKVLRWFSPVLLLAVLACTALLWPEPPFRALLWAQLGFYASAVVGMALSRLGLSVPGVASIYHFVSMNAALLGGLVRCLRGIKTPVWERTERTDA
jgi:cellulose synthase/poly-beta-1,6-N-acetylglucosamine synthase-like glycosyltransferase